MDQMLARMGASDGAAAERSCEAESELLVVDDLLHARAQERVQLPFIAFPRSEKELNLYEQFTSADMDQLVEGACSALSDLGFTRVLARDSPVVALLGASDRNYVVTMFALSRLGYCIMLLSPRLSLESLQALYRRAECEAVFYGPGDFKKASGLSMNRCVPLLDRENYENRSPLGAPDAKPTLSGLSERIAFILHSSGSTGLPTLVKQTHAACLDIYKNGGHQLRGLLTAPLFHLHGLGTIYRTLHERGTVFLYNFALPLTSLNLISTLNSVRPRAFYGVPYTIKLLVEQTEGIELLADCEFVSAAGSVVPEELGSKTTAAGVHLVSFYGMTETGGIMSSVRSRDDKLWDFMAFIPSVRPYVWMKPLGTGKFELVILDGLKSKTTSNSNDPPNSFYTNDIFEPHPLHANRWKYIGRKDDRITLVNGEKVLPLPIEGCIRQHQSVREAVVFGAQQDVPGILIFRSESARHLSDDQLIDNIWPVVELANSRSEAFSQITRNTIITFSADAQYPQTDKGTIMRSKLYRDFSNSIDELYQSMNSNSEDTSELSTAQLEETLWKVFRDDLGLDVASGQSDLFSSGMDSLKAIQASTFIKKRINLGGHGQELTQSQIYQRANINELAKYLYELRTGSRSHSSDGADIACMHEMVSKYSSFSQFSPRERATVTNSGTVVLTGVTGSLGAHTLVQLLSNDSIGQVACLVRASSLPEAESRLFDALSRRSLSIPRSKKHRVTVLPCDLGRENLGLSPRTLADLQSSLTLIIHIAWSVNFNLGLSSFENQHISGVRNLLNLSLSVHREKPARFLFCSSISAAGAYKTANDSCEHPDPTGTSTLVPEEVIGFEAAQGTGYAQSKCIAEHIILNARRNAGADCAILRIGQVVGDRKSGLWNSSEAIPLMLSMVESIGFPDLDDLCAWLPVDVVAEIIVEAGDVDVSASITSPSRPILYNIVHPRPFKWSSDLLAAVRACGLECNSVSPKTWVERMQSIDQAPEQNPALRLIDFWSAKYLPSADGTRAVPQRLFDMHKAMADFESLREADDLIKMGLICKFLQNWRIEWAEWRRKKI